MRIKKNINKKIIENRETKVIVQMPNEIEIELVQANELKHYELFQWLVALLLPIAVGFWTAYFTGNKRLELFWSALVFLVISGLFGFLAYRYRKKVFSGSIKKGASLDLFKKEKIKGRTKQIKSKESKL